MAGIRIGGLASGMDIDQIVSDLMKAERMPLDKLSQKKQYLEWQRDDYREMNKSLLELDKLIFDGILKQASYIKKNIAVSDPNALSIRNINSTSDFSGSMVVNSLATAATMNSTPINITDSSKPLSQLGIAGTQEMIIKAIDKTGAMETTGYKLSFDPEVETLDSLISKINSNSGVTAFFDQNTKRISVIAKNTGGIDDPATAGEEHEISLESSTDFWMSLNLAPNNNSGTQGSNASVVYNGLPITRSSNTFIINGVEFTLKQTTNTSTNPTINFSSSANTDAILETIVSFVDKYNSLIDKIKGETEEKKYRDFQPLTSEQKEAMDEKNIERWEEKARSGTLRGDSILLSALDKMRINLYSAVSGIAGNNQLSEIGITTSKNYRDGGKLTINSDKLKKALSENPTAVYELFAKDGTGDSKGVGQRLRDTIKATMSNIEKRAGNTSSGNTSFTIGRNLDSLDDQILRFQDRLIQVENRYWRQFTAMEKAIQQANSQSMYLMQQFGGGY